MTTKQETGLMIFRCVILAIGFPMLAWCAVMKIKDINERHRHAAETISPGDVFMDEQHEDPFTQSKFFATVLTVSNNYVQFMPGKPDEVREKERLGCQPFSDYRDKFLRTYPIKVSGAVSVRSVPAPSVFTNVLLPLSNADTQLTTGQDYWVGFGSGKPSTNAVFLKTFSNGGKLWFVPKTKP